MAGTDDPRRAAPRGGGARRVPGASRLADTGGRPFPPTVPYAGLEGLPPPVRFVVSSAALPLDFAVTSVRILKNVELLLGEIAVQLRILRPAVAAAGQAYLDGRFDPVLDTVEDVRHGGSDAIAVVRAPFTTAREVVRPAGQLGPADEAELIGAESPTPPPPTLSSWLGGLGGQAVDRVATGVGALPGSDHVAGLVALIGARLPERAPEDDRVEDGDGPQPPEPAPDSWLGRLARLLPGG